ncbi:MAG TPA: plastocyanin/azurin family copper-binding protein [Dehalococcoidia bacterium]|nr:plastocyanin/azurin family copper-binding protein [Dehalococcoidia bacterium]
MRKLASILLHGRPLAYAVLALALAGGAGLLFGSSPDVSAATKFTVWAGGGNAGISIDAFRPGVININEGDSIEFNNPFEEIHTVTFLAGEKVPDFIVPVPQAKGPPKLQINSKAANAVPARGAATYDGSKWVNSGILAKGTPATSFTVSFPKGGSFEYICIVHPFMTGTVNVLPSGTWVPAQADIDKRATAALEAELKKAEGIAASQVGKKVANGWEVLTPGAPPGIAIQRFSPSRLSIAVGETVTWKNDNPGPPHTVTFGYTPQPTGFLSIEPAGGDNPPNLFLDQKVAFPAKPSPNYEGTGYYNSGLILSGPEATGGTSFSLTFTKAGTYNYVCVLHLDQGMAGVVIVGDGGGAAGGGPGGAILPPNTGDAGLADNTSMTPWLLAAAVVLVVGLGGLGLAKVRMSR